MFTAISIISVILYISALGVTTLTTLCTFNDPCFQDFKSARLIKKIGAALALGILFNYFLNMVSPSFFWSIVLGCLIIVASLFTYKRYKELWAPRSFSIFGSFELMIWMALIVALSTSILFEGIGAWDSRSIWFFHAKISFSNSGFAFTDAWTEPAYLEFTHMDYPKLVPSNAGQLAWIVGFWNEFIPKTSLLIIFATAMAIALSYARGVLSFLALFVVLIPVAGNWYGNGYMDGYLTIFGSFALLGILGWLYFRDTTDLVLSILSLGICFGLKNESMLMFVTIAAVLLPTILLLKPRLKSLAESFFTLSGSLLSFCALSAAGSIAWWSKKSQWSLTNDLTSTLSSEKVLARLTDIDAVRLIYNSLTQGQLFLFVFIFAEFYVLICFTRGVSAKAKLLAIVPGLGAILYFLGLFMIYLGTPYDLNWHLGTSADRTQLSVIGFLVTGVVFICWLNETAPYYKER